MEWSGLIVHQWTDIVEMNSGYFSCHRILNPIHRMPGFNDNLRIEREGWIEFRSFVKTSD